ncbi:uncharacterized protein [Primulina huaijiensis]|uniref:uncharacterized protein n=1 Tax=Primulina huaijiensis TaxID=1492673 RepID=UPI003CC70B39
MSSRLEEDKSLQQCRARKAFIKHALNGRCSVASARIAYIEELKILGVALRRFVELDTQVESFAYPSRSWTPEPSQIDAAANMSPSLTPQMSSHRNSHHMKFCTTLSKKVEEEPPVPVSVTVTRRSTDASETSFETPPWDFFGIFNPVDVHFSSQEGRGIDGGLDYSDGGAVASPLITSCFSCGDNPSEIQKEPLQNSMKYLTWLRTASAHYVSSQNLVDANSFDNTVYLSKNIFDNIYMVSGSHASTLGSLYAWEKKLYDEVKAGQVLRSNFDQKCKFLLLQESRGQSTEKARYVVKDLHSRIRVSVHRI